MSRHTNASRYLQLSLAVVVLLIAATLRIVNLGDVPPGFDNAEIATLQISETARMGTIATFYNVGDPADLHSGHEGLYPILQAVVTMILGTGPLPYRILPLWCGLISVALAFALTRRLFGSFAGLAAAVTLAVSLWPLVLSHAAIRETLLLPLTLGMLLALAHALHLRRRIGPDSPETPAYALLGILVALMAYAHWTGLIAIPLIVSYLVYLITTRQPISRRVIGFAIFTMLIALIFAIPYITFTVRAFALSGVHVAWANRPQNAGGLLIGIVRTVGAIFLSGDSMPEHNLPGSPLIGPVGAILLLIGVVTAVQRWSAPNMVFALLALVVGLMPAAWAHDGPDFGVMTVALPALAALTGLGASVVASRLWRVDLSGNLPRSSGPALSGGLALTLPTALIVGIMFFNTWANDPAVDQVYRGQLGRLADYLDHTHDGLTTSVCTFNLDGHTSISDRALLTLMMHGDDANWRFSDCLTGFVLAKGGERQRVAFAEPDGSTQVSPLFLPWLKSAQPVTGSQLTPGSVVELTVDSDLADTLGKLTFSPVDWAPEASGPSAKASLPVRMGGYLTFEGYILDTLKVYKPGDTVSVITYWRADGDQLPDLRIFAHILRNPNTEPIVQNDTLSTDASLLRDRDVFMQIINIPLPPRFPEGEFYVSVGAYSNDTGQRLPVYDQDQPRGDRLFLSKIKVGTG